MKDGKTWINEIEKEIERLKNSGRHVYFQFSIDMTQKIAMEIERYFKESYRIEIRRCQKCVNKYDLSIEF